MTDSAVVLPPAQIVLTWGRSAGGLGHCDQLTIHADGQLEAVVCVNSRSEPTIRGQLSEEQLARVLAWVTEYSTFTRREMEMSNAVRTTTLNGGGTTTPDLEVKKEIAAFAADIFFDYTTVNN